MYKNLDKFITALTEIVGEDNLILEEKIRLSRSRDCFHFSPVLLDQLKNKAADVIAKPATQAQLAALISCAVTYQIPITPRGAGTGNYGQGVPLFGGVLVDTKNLNRFVEINAEEATVESGVILYEVEKRAQSFGAELRIFPSTVPTASVGGFITGGSGGIGSIEWGMLREADNVRRVKIMTIEEEPRIQEVSGSALEGVLHNCGLTCFVVEVSLALAPKRNWNQFVLSFDDFYAALAAGQALAENDSLRKRLVTAFEWPMPSFFVPLVKKGACPEGKSAVFLYTDSPRDEVESLAVDLGGTLSFFEPCGDGKARGTQIYDYTWNHTTQWAMKSDPSLTYLQDRYEISRMFKQIRDRKEAFPDELIEHVEFTKSGGAVVAGGLTVVRYSTKERLWALIEYCEDHHIRVANPHTYYLDDDNRWYGDAFLAAKQAWDPHGLLNPGHLHALEDSNVAV